MASEIRVVFDAWTAKRGRPSRLTALHEALIADRLERGFKVADLTTLFDYAWEATNSDARWWRGDNPKGKRYLGLENLFRLTKLRARIANANAWRWHCEQVEAGAILGPLGDLRQR